MHQIKRSYYEFSVPKDFQVGGIQFFDSEFVDRTLLDWDYFSFSTLKRFLKISRYWALPLHA